MPRAATVPVPARTFVALTTADVTRARVQNPTNTPVRLIGTTTDAAPAGLDGALWLFARQTFSADILFEHIWPDAGIKRLWAWSEGAAALEVAHG
ncbi:hypothetical protein FBT96_19990 [Rhodobacter capsulatus]|uniref:Uncharacterized protein n=1 Tax=Rhodobacter capsulatus TaxID=1061 RepID=A0A4U1JLD3_RHOCA|nr:hypothetical protein [Rhodobacter capsulatus]TKD12907.1 hypothetical protein FBT96_19990 [Rhodobacter capsulatus]